MSINISDDRFTPTLDKIEKKLDYNKVLATDYSEVDGVRTFLDYQGDNIITHTLQDPTDIYKQNELERKEDNWNKSEEFKKVATIPIAQFLQWEALGITEDPKALLKAIEMDKKLKTTNRRL